VYPQSVVKVRGKNAGNAILGPLKIAGELSQALTAINGTSRFRGVPLAYSRTPKFFRVPGPPNLYFNYCPQSVHICKLYQHCILVMIPIKSSTTVYS